VKDCVDRNDRNKLEDYWIIQTGATLNTQRPGRTKKQWNVDNRERLVEQSVKYRTDNRLRIAEYREDNKERFLEYQRDYYENNKGKQNEKHTCDCGGRYTLQNKQIHNRSKRHQDYLFHASTTNEV